jgi:hypothetical protein
MAARAGAGGRLRQVTTPQTPRQPRTLRDLRGAAAGSASTGALSPHFGSRTLGLSPSVPASSAGPPNEKPPSGGET